MEVTLNIMAVSNIPDDATLDMKDPFVKLNGSSLVLASKVETGLKRELPISKAGNMSSLVEQRTSLFYSTIEDNKITAVLNFLTPKIVNIDNLKSTDLIPSKNDGTLPASIVVCEVVRRNYNIVNDNNVLDTIYMKDMPISAYNKSSYTDAKRYFSVYDFNTEQSQGFGQY